MRVSAHDITYLIYLLISYHYSVTFKWNQASRARCLGLFAGARRRGQDTVLGF